VQSRTVKLVAAGAVVAAAALAVGLTLWLTSGSSSAKPLSHASYAHLYVAATVGTTNIASVRSTWPKPPYQDYHDNMGNHCLEWFDRPAVLYDLCFNQRGVLATKMTP
jgi:hypothetical protein